MSSRFQNVRVAAEMHAAHSAGFAEMGKGPFQTLTSQPQQAEAPCAANAPTIAEHNIESFRILPPVSSATIGFQVFEVANVQQPEVASWRQPWSTVVRVESLAQIFDVLVEVRRRWGVIAYRTDARLSAAGYPSRFTSTPALRAAVACPSPWRQCRTGV
jgi:hypothetical protein